jgi:hypothetical protein
VFGVSSGASGGRKLARIKRRASNRHLPPAAGIAGAPHDLHRLPASEILCLAGVEKQVHAFTAAYPLRTTGVQPHDPAWLWGHLDYRLPTTVLAAVWRVNKGSVVNARRRLKPPRALWHAKDDNSRDRAYNAALARERRKARRLFQWQRRRARRLKKLPPAV